ncbi:hypothetical protein [Dechloromonas denitrificans]|nr:hypothetical protein [Dechloromonas denitrificans]
MKGDFSEAGIGVNRHRVADRFEERVVEVEKGAVEPLAVIS